MQRPEFSWQTPSHKATAAFATAGREKQRGASWYCLSTLLLVQGQGVGLPASRYSTLPACQELACSHLLFSHTCMRLYSQHPHPQVFLSVREDKKPGVWDTCRAEEKSGQTSHPPITYRIFVSTGLSASSTDISLKNSHCRRQIAEASLKSQ